MRVLKVTSRVSKAAAAEVAAVLRAGGVVAFPTETSYGLAADPRNAAAVKKIFAIKRRPAGKALPLVAASAEAVREACMVIGVARDLAALWPAPLTLVLPARKRGKLAAVATPEPGKTYATVAVRVPRSAWARAVAAAAGGLATSTSANLSGDAPIHDPRKLIASFRSAAHRPDLVLDAGVLPPRPASTIARPSGHRVTVLRQGSFRIAVH